MFVIDVVVVIVQSVPLVGVGGWRASLVCLSVDSIVGEKLTSQQEELHANSQRHQRKHGVFRW